MRMIFAGFMAAIACPVRIDNPGSPPNASIRESQPMKKVCLQLQVPKGEIAVLEDLDRLATALLDFSGAREIEKSRGAEANVDYSTLLAGVDAVGAFWATAKPLLATEEFELLRGSMIVTAQGRRGWDDYVLLHHFDPLQKLDHVDMPSRRSS